MSPLKALTTFTLATKFLLRFAILIPPPEEGLAASFLMFETPIVAISFNETAPPVATTVATIGLLSAIAAAGGAETAAD